MTRGTRTLKSGTQAKPTSKATPQARRKAQAKTARKVPVQNAARAASRVGAAVRGAQPMPLALSIQCGIGIDAPPVARPQLRRWVSAALHQAAELTLRFVGIDEGRQLNRDFRGRDYATNVLTFSYAEHGTPDPDAPAIADLVICLPVVAREADEQRKTLRDHLAHMVVHGTLHAQGHDHEDEDEAMAMETLERGVLARFRIADPYGGGERHG